MVPTVVYCQCVPDTYEILVISETNPATPQNLEVETPTHPTCFGWSISPIADKLTMLKVYNVAIDPDVAGIIIKEDLVTKGDPIMNGDEIVVLTETSADLKIILETFDAAIGSTQAFTIEVSPVPDATECTDGAAALTATDAKQIGTAPGFPITTGATPLCVTVITDPEGGDVTMTFLSLDLAEPCIETLTVDTDGTIDDICATDRTLKTYTGTSITITFSSDSAFRKRGYTYEYSKKADDPVPPEGGPKARCFRER
ncbi:hypothetical protein ScPMuIL_008119 [Solemya velum]